MGRRMHALFAVLVAVVYLAPLALGAESSHWPATLLEHTAMASGRWASTPRTRLEKLQLTMAQSAQTHLAAPQDRHSYFAEGDMVDHPADSEGAQRDNADRSREPLSNHFGDATINTPPVPRADRQPCGGQGRKLCTKPEATIDSLVTPPSIAPPRPLPPAIPAIPAKSKDPEFPTPPIPELPLATPLKPKPGCGDLCNPRDHNDPTLVRVPAAPLGDLDVANADKELPAVNKVIAKLDNRAVWLSAQKHWLVKATDAAASVRREIESAEHTKAAVASDLEQLQIAQNALSVRLKANQLKWSFKDKKMTLEQLHKRLVELQHAKAHVAHAMRDTRDDVKVLETTLGTPSQQLQISLEEVEDPLKFLDDIKPEEDFNV